MTSTLGLIPARGGSKGLPGKNLRLLAGKPLIVWSIEQALSSTSVDKVVVSTDSLEIAEVAKQAGAEVPFIRPSVFAGDTSTSQSVAEHALDFYKKSQKIEFENLVLIEPTSPLRTKDDLNRAVRLLDEKSSEFDAIASVGLANHHPNIMKKIDDSGLITAFYENDDAHLRRQEQEVAYFPFGVAYAIKTDTLIREKTFYPQRTCGMMIQNEQCFEIDNLLDFQIIELILNKGIFKF